MDGMDKQSFWLEKTLAQMSAEEWESLCDGCALCCLEKQEDIDTGRLVFSKVACAQLDIAACRCKVYARRHEVVPACLPIRAMQPAQYRWLPETCAYRRVHEGRDLPDWHPIKTGDPDSARKAGVAADRIARPPAVVRPWRRWRGS